MVSTEADDRLESAREHLSEAIKDLAEIVIHECWGHDDFTDEARDKFEETMTKLITMKREL